MCDNIDVFMTTTYGVHNELYNGIALDVLESAVKSHMHLRCS